MSGARRPIDLRSDTVTRPTEAMRAAMAQAEVGDDVYGEDPSARALEERVAQVLGKEAALYVPSGSMANQVALMWHCRPGDEAIIGQGAHLCFYEGGAGGAFAGVQFVPVGTNGLFTAEEMTGGIKPEHYVLPRTRLVAVENTHNRAGGRVFPQRDVEAIAAAAREHGLGVHMDGARVWNASIATGKAPAELAAPADTVSACFSKGLGAPVGSVICGSREAVEGLRRIRRMMGGALRQVGILCAGALHALEHHRERLADDHANAKRLAEGVANVKGLSCDLAAVETNIVSFEVDAGDADGFVRRATEAGVLLGAIGPGRVRAVTHLDVGRGDIDRAVEALARVASG